VGFKQLLLLITREICFFFSPIFVAERDFLRKIVTVLRMLLQINGGTANAYRNNCGNCVPASAGSIAALLIVRLCTILCIFDVHSAYMYMCSQILVILITLIDAAISFDGSFMNW